MSYMQQIEEKKKMAARLRSADQSVTLDIFKNYIPHDLSYLLLDKVFAVSADDKDNLQEEDDVPQKTVPSLVDLCATLVGSDKSVVDTLYAIYGPDANFPFPSWLGPKVQKLSKVEDHESKFKLALLLSNNATTSFKFFFSNDDEETEVSKVLGPLVWKKLSSVCKKLQIVRISCTSDYDEDDPDVCDNPEFCWTENILRGVQQMSGLRVLEVPNTAFLDADLAILGAALPQLKRFEFKFDGRVTLTGVQALGQLKKLEELLFDPGDDDLMDLENYVQIIDSFTSWCLGTLPWLKVLCANVNEDDTVFEHTMPLMEYGQVLSLEHLQVRGFLKVADEDNYKDGSALVMPYLSNVRFLKLQGLDNDEDLIENLVDSKMDKLEKLMSEEGCECIPLRLLLGGIGQNLSEIDLEDCKGAWNILRILEGVPVAKDVRISSSLNGNKGFYSFNDHSHLKQVSPNLVFLYLNLENKEDCKLPQGVLTRLLELPNLAHLTLNNLLLPAEECNQVALKIKSGVLKLPNLCSFTYRSGGDDSSFLVAVFCVYCPKFRSVDVLRASGPFKRFLFVLSALLYPRIKVKDYR